MSPARFLRPLRPGAAIVAISLGALPLGACGERTAVAEGDGPSSDPAVAAAPAVSSDLVPTPALFEATGTVRWDGRRTLQGVWVAHPRASAARRVRIYNAATGAAADGALFTRDPVLSGPSMLVSSDAANLLGLAPGEEAELRVVALTPPPAGGDEVLAAAPSVPPDAGGSGRAADAVVPRTPASGDAVASTRPAPAPPAAEPPASASRGAARTAAPGAAAEGRRPASAVATAAAGAPTPAEGGSLAEPRSPAADPAPPAVPAARDAAPGPASLPRSAAPGPTAEAGPAAPARPYVQAGLFGVKGNAERLIRRIEAEGLPAIGRPVRLATGQATRVLAGPFATAAERDAARRRIQAMGLPDAVPVAR